MSCCFARLVLWLYKCCSLTCDAFTTVLARQITYLRVTAQGQYVLLMKVGLVARTTLSAQLVQFVQAAKPSEYGQQPFFSFSVRCKP